MTTLADKVHDSFDAYYAGKKTGWTAQKPAQQDAAWRKKAQMQRAQPKIEADVQVESRH